MSTSPSSCPCSSSIDNSSQGLTDFLTVRRVSTLLPAHHEVTMKNWRSFDLNLLTVFDAVMQERNVTRAGKSIGLSQPAMSHALTRLRHLLKDELFVPTRKGMVPTPRAEMLAQSVRHVLSEMQLALEPAAAPRVRLDLRPSGTLDVVDLLDRGDLDLAITGIGSPGKRFASVLLLEDPFVMVMRRGHPASRRKLSAAAFAALPHLEISSSLEDTSFIDRWLAERGVARRIALRAPYLSAAALLLHSDLVATLSRRFAQVFVRDHPLLQLCKPPYQSPCVRTVMLWHRRLDGHPAHRWLRDVIVSVTKHLESSSSFPIDMPQ